MDEKIITLITELVKTGSNAALWSILGIKFLAILQSAVSWMGGFFVVKLIVSPIIRSVDLFYAKNPK